VVDGGDGPCDADAKEHVDGVATGNVADRRVGILVVDRRHLARKRVYTSPPPPSSSSSSSVVPGLAVRLWHTAILHLSLPLPVSTL